MRFGIIGTNFISDRFMASLPFTSATATAVYSRKEETGNAFAQRHGIQNVFTSLADFMASPLFDAVYIASPNLCHKEQTLLAMSFGKHVLCEKPAAPSKREWDEMRKKAKEQGCILMEAMRPLYDSMWEKIIALLPTLGKIRSGHFDYCQYSSRYDRFKAGETLNAFDPSLSNAALLDIGVYPLAVAARLFGMPKTILSHSVKLAGGFEGGGEVILGYGDSHLTVSYSKIASSVCPSCILGENGSLSFDKVSEPTHIRAVYRDGRVWEHTRESMDAPDNMFEEIAAFCRAVETGTAFHESTTSVTLQIMDEVRRQNSIVFPSDGM